MMLFLQRFNARLRLFRQTRAPMLSTPFSSISLRTAEPRPRGPLTSLCIQGPKWSIWLVLVALTLVVQAGLLPTSAFAQTPALIRSLTLAAAEDLMIQRNRDLAVARRVLEQAQADVLTAGQRPNPQLSWTTQNINPNRGIGNGDPRSKTVDTIFRVDQLIERGGKAELRTETARRLESAVSEDISELSRQQRLALRYAYFDLLAAQEKVASSNETVQLYARTVEAAQLRLKAGDLAAADVARIRVDALRAQNDSRALEAEAGRQRVALAYLIGAEKEAGEIRVVSPWPAVAPGMVAPSSIDASQLDARPDIKAAQARVAAADKARELAQSLRTRDVSVGVQVEHWPNRADANNQGTGNSFGVALSVPLFLRHSNEGEIARAQADWYAARDALERVQAQARSEVARAAGDLASARERLTRFEAELLKEAERSAAAAEFAFKNGAIGVMDLLDARRTLKLIQLDAISARADLAKAAAAWEVSVGTSVGASLGTNVGTSGR
jgi:outer membrane protein, heavy metal efflux system